MRKILKVVIGFFTKKWVKWAVMGVLLFFAVLFTGLYNQQRQDVKRLRAQVEAGTQQIENQNAIIDSLNGRQMHTVCITLTVTDQSKMVLRGGRNKGTITMPSERTYRIELDSISFENGFKQY